MDLSVIIPTFNNVDYLKELIESIENSKFQGEIEVLIGIDACEETLNFVYNNEFPYYFKFLNFSTNGGPYLIKNTLVELSSFEKLFFFDSDDVMMPDLLQIVSEKLDHYDCVKPKYVEFEDNSNGREYKKEKGTFGEGVFGIKKTLFLSMNGFEGWRVAADSDFMARLYNSHKKVYYSPHILFHRRVHENSLTIHPDTGLASKLRAGYYYRSKNKKKDMINLSELKKSEFQYIDYKNKTLSEKFNEEVYELSEDEIEKKKRRDDAVSTLFSNQPTIVNSNSIQKKIDYDRINRQTNHPIASHLSVALKKAKLENIRKNSRR